MSKQAKWGYLAGMIDGEGYITIIKGKNPAPNGRGIPVTTNTPNCSEKVGFKSMGWKYKPNKVDDALEQMIESGLVGNNESAPAVTQTA